MTKLTKVANSHKWIVSLLMVVLIVGVMAVPCLAADEPAQGDVAGAVEATWTDAKEQVKSITDNVVFPVIDMILAILFFVKTGTAYFEYRKHGQFEFAAPCILFACLIFTLTAPLYIWNIIG